MKSWGRNWIVQVAKELHKSPETIRGWARRGLIDGVRRKPPRVHHRVVDQDAFNAWLEMQRPPSVSTTSSTGDKLLTRAQGETRDDFVQRVLASDKGIGVTDADLTEEKEREIREIIYALVAVGKEVTVPIVMEELGMKKREFDKDGWAEIFRRIRPKKDTLGPRHTHRVTRHSDD